MDFTNWTKATGDLLPGQQAVFLDVLNLVSEGKAHLVYGADYRDGKPCLVNAVGAMLTTSGGQGVPTQYFPAVVCEFDRLNGEFYGAGINTDGFVSPLAADILIRNFGEVKEMIVETPDPVSVEATPVYVEPSDTELMQSWLAAMQAPAPEALNERDDAEAEYVRAHVDFPNG